MINLFLKRFLCKLAFIMPGGDSLRPWLHSCRGVKIGKNVWISQYVYIDEIHPEAVTICDNVTIGLRSSIFTHFYWGRRRHSNGPRHVIIEEGVFIGPHCLILPGVRIGRNSVIRAGTVVTRNVPENTFWSPPQAGPIAHVTVPLTAATGYEEFMRGLRPLRMSKRAKNNE